MNAPIDQTHAESIAAVNEIRGCVAEIRGRIRSWEPRPLPVRNAGIRPS